jgi:hypothetical protein
VTFSANILGVVVGDEVEDFPWVERQRLQPVLDGEGFPNPVPHLSEWGDLLPIFREEKDDDPVQHLIDFHQCMEQLNLHQEDVLMKMFMFSLKDDARDWYFSLPAASISTLREFHVAFNLHCKRYYSSEFLFHDCCEEYEKSVQAALSFSPDCEVEEDNLVKEISEGSMLSSSCSSVLDADLNDSSDHKNTVDISPDYEAEINDKLVKKTREVSSLFFPSFSELKADFVCCSYEENAEDIFVLETYVFSSPCL